MIEDGLIQGETFLMNPSNSTFKESLWDHVITDDIPVNNTAKNLILRITQQTNKITGYKKLIRRAESKLREYTSFTIYYANLEDVLSNYFFFSFRKDSLKERVIVEDGALNYYFYREKDLPRFNYLMKLFLSNMIGVPFRRIKGDVSGIEYDYVRKQFVRAPNLAVYPEKSLQLPFKRISYKCNKDTILIIGQEPYSNFLGENVYETGLKQLCGIIESRIDKQKIKVFYKPHRDGSYSEPKRVLDRFFIDYEILPREGVIEELICNFKPAQIYSFDSSALANLKIATQQISNLQIFAYLFFSEKLIHLYRQLRIEIISLKS